MYLLSRHNTKLVKSKDKGFLSQGVHLAPHKSSGKNMCPHASKGCTTSCLNTSGFGYSKMVQKARLNRTILFNTDRNKFLTLLHQQIQNKIKNVRKQGFEPTFRLNLTSDVNWESVKFNGKSMMEHFPDVQFYDYTKDMSQMLRFITGSFPKNYHLTFSRSETNERDCEIVLACGGNVAVVFAGKFPKKYMGKRVVDGMSHDLRFLDPKKVVVGLRPIGKAKKDTTGFVVR